MGPRRHGGDAEQAFVAAVESLGLEARAGSGVGADRGADLVLFGPDGPAALIQIKSVSLVTADSARRVSGEPHRADDGVLRVVVADRITAEAREFLNRAGRSWLDLRGHLRLVARGLLVDADVPTLSPHRSEPSGLRGRVGIEFAALALLAPEQPVGVRAAAAILGRAPSSVSAAIAALRAADLIDAAQTPVVPELFWELAGHWSSPARNLVNLPGTGRPRDDEFLQLHAEDVAATSGWALTDTVAAAAYGAPVSMRADHPPDFYVPDEGVLRRAAHLLGSADSPQARVCRVRVAPVSLVCGRRVDGTGRVAAGWPLAAPLFVALDLAQDPGRGREILDAWTPEGPWTRVW